VSNDQTINFSELTLEAAILDSLAANIAVLDSTGVIVAVNRSWQDFAADNAMVGDDYGVGVNYLDVCRAAEPDPKALQAIEGIEAVMDGRLPSFYLKYPCHSPSETRWFALRASPLLNYPSHVVVAHENITEQVLDRISPRSPR
jgi:PAS domain-containing protein